MPLCCAVLCHRCRVLMCDAAPVWQFNVLGRPGVPCRGLKTSQTHTYAHSSCTLSLCLSVYLTLSHTHRHKHTHTHTHSDRPGGGGGHALSAKGQGRTALHHRALRPSSRAGQFGWGKLSYFYCAIMLYNMSYSGASCTQMGNNIV